MKKGSHFFLYIFVSLFFLSCSSTATTQQEITLSKELLSSKLLNSERIKQKFGNYGIEVLSHTDVARVSNLFSSHKGAKITRTFAVVNYSEKIDSSYIKIHSQIVKGASIGRIFKKNEWKIVKKPLFKGVIKTEQGSFSLVYNLMSIRQKPLAFYMYDFYVKKDNQQYKYATITEVYHPQYINTKTLDLMYKDLQIPVKKTTEVDTVLKTVYKKMQSN